MMEKTLGIRTAFRGRLLQVDVVDVELEPGVRSVREIVRHPGATAVLPQLPDGRFVLVRQFRKAVEAVLLEVVAGGLEPGESPEAGAARELREETGYQADELTKLGEIFPAPGYTEEKLHLYHAVLNPQRAGLAPEDDERIEVVILPGAEIETRIARGEICDAKTLCAWLLLQGRAGGMAANTAGAGTR